MQFQDVGLFLEEPDAVEEGLHVPPVYTKTWFHTGAYLERKTISHQFIDEYYQDDPQMIILPDTLLTHDLDYREENEACRALKGQILRQEIFALDNSEKNQHPYCVSTFLST